MLELNDDLKNELSKLFEVTEDCFQSAKDSLKDGHSRAAMNRTYYTAFYCMNALAKRHGFQTSKHSSLIGWFYKNYINPKLIDRKFGDLVSETSELRVDADYDMQVETPDENIKAFWSVLSEFIELTKKLSLQE